MKVQDKTKKVKFWMMLRGELDTNNRRNYTDDTDMWINLIDELASPSNSLIWWKGDSLRTSKIVEPSYIFARGGFDYYIPILKKFPKAYKIYYGAGRRHLPDDKIKYNLILVDTAKQKEEVLKKFPGSNVHTWLKPAAKHFKPMPDVKKKYDVCYVANCHSKFQEKIKRVKWVYKTAPKKLKILHLGKSSVEPPPNIQVKKVTLKEMPKYINQCNAMIVPYRSYDSAPRVIEESTACDVEVFPLPSVNQERHLVYPKNIIWAAISKYKKSANKSMSKILPITIE